MSNIIIKIENVEEYNKLIDVLDTQDYMWISGDSMRSVNLIELTSFSFPIFIFIRKYDSISLVSWSYGWFMELEKHQNYLAVNEFIKKQGGSIMDLNQEINKTKELLESLLEKQKKLQVQLSELLPGETFKIGKHDFIVLKQDCLQTSIISKDIMLKNIIFGDSHNYNKSYIKEKIEFEIQPMIEKCVGEKNLMVSSASLTSVDSQNEFGRFTGYVRPLTFDEARRYNDLLVNKNLTDWWWTLTPWSSKERECRNYLAVVSSSGGISNCNYDESHGVRPFCILNSNIFVSRA